MQTIEILIRIRTVCQCPFYVKQLHLGLHRLLRWMVINSTFDIDYLLYFWHRSESRVLLIISKSALSWFNAKLFGYTYTDKPNFYFLYDVFFPVWQIEALTALVGRLSLSVGWEKDPERGRNTVSFNPLLPVI